MKCLEINPAKPVMISIAAMKDGQVGKTTEGYIYVKYLNTAFCLNSHGKSYSENACYAKEENGYNSPTRHNSYI